MKKKILLSLLLFTLIFSFTGCVFDKSEKNKEETDKKEDISIIITSEGSGKVGYSIGKDKPVNFVKNQPIKNYGIIVEKGNVINLEATPDNGYQFVVWSVNNKEYSKDSKITIEITKNLKIVAVFG